MSWLNNNFRNIDYGKESFIRSINKDNDKKVTVKELYDFVNQNGDQITLNSFISIRLEHGWEIQPHAFFLKQNLIKKK